VSAPRARRWGAARAADLANPVGGEDGSVALPLVAVLWLALLLAIVFVDIAAYLLAASRAQGAADAAALAAAAADLVEPAPPVIVARSVAGRNGARVDACDCRAGGEQVAVTVSVPVGGLFLARHVGAERVTASAEALLVEDEAAPGGTVDHPW
jgi:uncharacterized membrane protein